MSKSISPQLFQIQPGSSEPIYRQIIAQVQRLQAAGQLLPGDILPSVREVAVHFAVNPMTVSKAYSALEAEGVLERRRGIGMALAARQVSKESSDQRLELLRPSMQRVVQEARQLELTLSEVNAELVRLFEEGEIR